MAKKKQLPLKTAEGDVGTSVYEYDDGVNIPWEDEGQSRPYVPLRKRRAMAAQEMSRLMKDGFKPQPVRASGKDFVTTPWALAWCHVLQSWSEVASRLPPGRTYLRHGAVVHLDSSKGSLRAYVQGSELYEVCIKVQTMLDEDWQRLKASCAGSVGSFMELIEGKIAAQVMDLMTSKDGGLFPYLDDITFHCTCPDPVHLCKHVAATLYGFAVKLDQSPELLFLLRGVEPSDLVTEVTDGLIRDATLALEGPLKQEEWSEMFGIDFDS